MLPVHLVFAVLMVMGTNAFARADECASCDASASRTATASAQASSSSYAAGSQRVNIRKSQLPQNGTKVIGRYDNFNVVGVFNRGVMVDFYLKHRESGKVIFGELQHKSLTIFKKCFERDKFGVSLRVCIEVQITL